MELTEKWLNDHGVEYMMSADGKIVIAGSLDLAGCTSITSLPEGLHVGGYLDLDGCTSITSLPEGLHVGGYLDLAGCTSITSLPEGLTANEIRFDGELDGHRFMVIDDIGCVVVSEKRRDGITIRFCRTSKYRDGKLTGEKMFVVSRGEHNAHGETLDAAMADLAFKTADRDISKYRNMPPDTTKTPHEWATIYRIITGACRFGTQSFMKQQGTLAESYTLAEIMKLTEGHFGHEKFKEVVNG